MPTRKIESRWYVDFYFGGERCRRKSPLNTATGAAAYELFLRKEAGLYGSIGAALRANSPINQTPCPTLNEFVPRWLRGYVLVNNRPAERRHKQRILSWHLLPHFGGTRLCDIQAEEIEGYKGKKREEGLAPKTINNHLAVLHRCLTVAKDWNALRTPVPRIPLLKAPPPTFRFLQGDECTALLNHAADQVHRTMVLMGLRTGMRFCELSALHWESLDLERRMVTVCRSLVSGHLSGPKNNRIRYIPLTTDITDALVALPRRGQYVFQNSGNPLEYTTAWKRLRRTAERAQVERVSWHDLRHTFASQLVERGVSLLAVQKLLGHSDIQVTMRYSHLRQDALRDAIAVLERAA